MAIFPLKKIYILTLHWKDVEAKRHSIVITLKIGDGEKVDNLSPLSYTD